MNNDKMKNTQRDTNTPVSEHKRNRRLSIESSPPRQVEAEHKEHGASGDRGDLCPTGAPNSTTAQSEAPSEIRLLVMEVSSGERWIQITSASGATFQVPVKPGTGPENQAGPSGFGDARAYAFQFLARDRCKVVGSFYLIQRNKVWTFCWEGHYQNVIVRKKSEGEQNHYMFIVPVPRAWFLRFEDSVYGLQNAEQPGEPLGIKVASDWPD